jgi:hypothetical protein
MGWFPCWGANAGFPWFMLIIPLFFFGMMFMFCRSGRGSWYAGCWNRGGRQDMTAELAGMRRDLEELKRKMG